MATVFRGTLEGAAGFSKPVAIKRLRPSLVEYSELREAFLQEADIARHLDHGNIVQIYDLGIDDDGVPYLVMDLVDGMSLDRLLESLSPGGRLPVADAMYIIEHVAAALAYGHTLTDADGGAMTVIHRDVSPKNILLSRRGAVKLTDFGIAKALHLPSGTLPGAIKGTIGYFAPEQASGHTVDARADQFATGLVLYELLSGHHPFAAADSLIGYCRLLMEGVPPLPVQAADDDDTHADNDGDKDDDAPMVNEVDDELAAIVARAVALDPEDRYADMESLRVALESWRVARGIHTSADGVRQTMADLAALAAQTSSSDTDSVVADTVDAADTSPPEAEQPRPAVAGALADMLAARQGPRTQVRQTKTPLTDAETDAGENADEEPALALRLPITRRYPRRRRQRLIVAAAAGAAVAVISGTAMLLRPPQPNTTSSAALSTNPNTTSNQAPAPLHAVPTDTADHGRSGALEKAPSSRAAVDLAPGHAPDLAPARAPEQDRDTGSQTETGEQTRGQTDEPARAQTAEQAEDRAMMAPRRQRPRRQKWARAKPAPSQAEPAVADSRLKINLIPYAHITIGDQFRGQTPVDLQLPAGSHIVILENPDTGQRQRRNIRLTRGQTLVINQW